MEVPAPAVIFAIFALNPVHPGFHAVVLFPQDAEIAGSLVHIPGDHRAGVAPDTGRMMLTKRGNDIGYHALQRLLLRPYVMQIFAIESVSIPETAGGGREDIGVTCPAHTLVPLRAVGGHIQEIAPQAPCRVFDQPIYLFVAGLNPADFFHIGVQHQRGEIFHLQIRNAVNLHISITEEGEPWFENGILTVRSIEIFRLRAAEIIPIEAAILQYFTNLDVYFRTGRLMHPQAENARLILSQIQHQLIFRCAYQLDGLQFLLYPHRWAEAVLQFVDGIVQHNHSLRRGFRQGVIPMLTVIDIGKGNRTARHLPACVRGDALRTSVRIVQPDLRQQSQIIAIIPSLTGLGSEAEASGIPSAAQLNGQLTAALQLFCYIMSDDLTPGIIVGAIGSQVLIAYLLAVDSCLVHTQTANIQPCPDYFSFRLNGAVKNRKTAFALRGDPASLPRLVHFARLKR